MLWSGHGGAAHFAPYDWDQSSNANERLDEPLAQPSWPTISSSISDGRRSTCGTASSGCRPRRASSAKQRGKPQVRVGLVPYVCIQHEARIDRRTGGHWCLRTESLIVYTQETAGAKTVTSETKAKVANYQKYTSYPADLRRYIYSCCSRLVRSLHVVLRGVHWFE